MTKYTAELSGSSWQQGPIGEFRTITKARQWAEAHGTTADVCKIRNSKGELVAEHRRDTANNGQLWFRAAI